MARLTIETEWSDGRELVPSVESKMAAAQLFFGELICFSFSCCLPEIFRKIPIIRLCSPNNLLKFGNCAKLSWVSFILPCLSKVFCQANFRKCPTDFCKCWSEAVEKNYFNFCTCRMMSGAYFNLCTLHERMMSRSQCDYNYYIVTRSGVCQTSVMV